MLSTTQVAAKSGVPFRTLTRWMALSKIRASTVFRQGTHQVHLWSDADVLKVRRYKREHFGEGRGRRKDLEGKGARKRSPRRRK